MSHIRRDRLPADQSSQPQPQHGAGLTRRQALRLALLSGAGGLVAACTSTSTQPAAQVPPPAPAPPAAETGAAAATRTVAAPTTAATAAPSAPAPTAAPTAQPATLSSTIARAATLFLASLDEAARSKATYAFGDAERQRWHWTTPRGFPRNGLPLREMNPDQRTLALDLLRASVSEAGYRKALDIMSLQNDLGSDPELYYVTVFGIPGGADPWGWRFEGHHISCHFAVVGDQVAVTPFFLGAWPTVANTGLRAMEREEAAARELVRSLEGASRATAIFRAKTLTNHVTQNDPWVSPLDPVGLPAGALSPDRQALLLEIVQTYLGVLPSERAATQLDRLRGAGVENIRFGWAGSVEPRRPHYYRLQGPTFLLEFDNSRNGGTHIHSVWRDFAEDFGRHLL